MIKVTLGKKEVQVAESINELTKKQLLELIKAVYFRPASSYDNYDFSRVILLKILLQQGELFFQFWKEDAGKACLNDCSNNCNNKCQYDELFEIELHELLKLTDPFFEKISKPESIKDFYTLKMNLSKQIIPYFYKNGIKWIGPDDALEDLSFDAWMNADLYYMHYLKTNDIQYLDKMIAELYEPRFIRYIRLVFPRIEKEQFFDLLKPIRNLKLELKMAILLFYISSRAFLADHFNKVFKIPKKEELEELQSKVIRSQWYDTKFNIAENGLFGDFNEVGRAKIASILKHIQILINRQEEEKLRRQEAALRAKKR